jgi:hypothetical protein
VPKIAICFAGLPRLTPDTEITWQRFIDRFEADVFVHTWLVSPNTTETVNRQIVKVLNPKLLITEPAKSFNIARYNSRIYPHRSEPQNVLSMWYSIKESINLCLNYNKEKQINYDIICRTRMDWWCSNLELIDDINDTITVPDDPGLSGHRFKYRNIQYTAHNDQFGYGKPNLMSMYATTFDHIPFLYTDEIVDFCSELFLTSNLISYNIPITYQKHLNYRMSRS